MRRDDPEPKSRWGPMVLASVVIHTLVISGAVILASGSPSPRTLYAPSMSVGLVGPGKVGLPPGNKKRLATPPIPSNTDEPRELSTPKAKVKAPVPLPTLEPRTKRAKPKTRKPPKTVIRVPKKLPRKQPLSKKRAATPRRDPLPKQAKNRPRKKPSALSAKTQRKPVVRKPAGKELDALARIRKRLLSRASQPAERGGTPGTERGGGGSSGPGGRDSYKNELARIFYAAWVLPQSIPTQGLKVDLIIHIDRSGRIVKTDIKSPSGNRLFDKSVLRAVAKVDTAGGLPPLPPEIPESLLVQGFRFDPKFHRGFIR